MGAAEGAGPVDRRDEMGLPVFPRAVGGHGLNRRRIDFCRRCRRLSDGVRCQDREKSLEDQHGQPYCEFTHDLYGEWTAVCDDAIRFGGTYFCSAAVIS